MSFRTLAKFALALAASMAFYNFVVAFELPVASSMNVHAAAQIDALEAEGY